MHEPQEGRKQAKTVATQLRLLFKRVTELAARDRIELALLATADHAAVQRVLEHVTRRRIEFAARLFQRLGASGAEAKRGALLAYSAYLGHAQLVHATPQLLPRTQAAKRAYLNDVLAALTSPPSPSEGSACVAQAQGERTQPANVWMASISVSKRMEWNRSKEC